MNLEKFPTKLSPENVILWLATKKALQIQSPDGVLASSDEDKAKLCKNHIA